MLEHWEGKRDAVKLGDKKQFVILAFGKWREQTGLLKSRNSEEQSEKQVS